MRRVLEVPNPVVYSYLADVYRNRFDPWLLLGRIAESEYVTLSLGASLQAKQNGPASRLAHDQKMSASVARAFLRVPWVLVGQWFRYKISGVPKDIGVDPVWTL